MAKLIAHPAVGQLTGLIGDLVFARYQTGRVVVRKRPVRSTAKTPAEAANQEEFAAAVAYAKAVWASQPELRARYNAAARVQGRQGFHLAKADFRLAPRVEEIELNGYTGNTGEVIRVAASDDFEVRGVQVEIRNLAGELIEEGMAVCESAGWMYLAQNQVPPGQTVTIEATATDHPGHTSSRRVDHACGPRV